MCSQRGTGEKPDSMSSSGLPILEPDEPGGSSCKLVSWRLVDVQDGGIVVAVMHPLTAPAPASPAIARVVVKEEPDAVVVAIYRHVGATEFDVGLWSCVRIEAIPPLSGRRLIDGATGESPPPARPAESALAKLLDEVESGHRTPDVLRPGD
jgi:hypothetical protein